METNRNSTPGNKTQIQQIDDIIKAAGDWHGRTLSHLRTIIRSADPSIIEEVKWKKPSKPSGVPVWSCKGIICIGDILKNSVRLTFPKGAQMKDPEKAFNTRLDSKTVRAIDFHENDTVNDNVVKSLILDAVGINTLKEDR